MNTLPTFRLAASLALLVLTTACGSSPSSPTASPVGDQPSSTIAEAADPAASDDDWENQFTDDDGDVEEDPGGTDPTPGSRVPQATCKPKFSKTSTKDSFFILKISFPSSCQWFAENTADDFNYWDLTVPNYDLRNREKYPDGYAGLGERKLGVHFIRKIGWESHRRFTLVVCSGSSCTPSSRKTTYRYSI